MPNVDGIDYAQMGMMTALIQFKRAHGDQAYLDLLAKFNAQRWSDIPATAHGEVVMTCKAGVVGRKVAPKAKAKTEDDMSSMENRLNEIAAKVYGTTASTNDFATIAAGAPDLKTAFDRYATAVHARNRGQ